MFKPKTLSVVYAHHEAHGPGIYHNELLSRHSNSLDMLYSNVMETNWKFPENVTLYTDRRIIKPWKEIYNRNILYKWFLFFKFTGIFLKKVFKNEYDLIVVFNPSALFSLYLIKFIIPRKTKLWYHNYDPTDSKTVKKYSQAWFANKAMYKLFPKLSLFTHSEERRNIFFPLDLLKNPYQILPNYPMIELHGGEKRVLKDNEIVLVFSGVISEGNGLEEIIKISHKKIGDREIKLILKGFIQEEYKLRLLKLIHDCKVESQVQFIGVGPWEEVPQVLRIANIGIHIFHKADLISQTMGKGGSGKVFQYIAEGLPVLMSPGFYTNFKEYNWAVPTLLSNEDLLSNIENIIEKYDLMSESAILSFKNELNCNLAFETIFNSIFSLKKN
jgi:glycosyltransferase involved in cell wall biosynthesis